MSPELQEAEIIVPAVQVAEIDSDLQRAVLDLYIADHVTVACGQLFNRTVQFDPLVGPNKNGNIATYCGTEYEVVGGQNDGQPIVNRYEATFSVEPPDFWARVAAWMRRKPQPGIQGRLVRGCLINMNETT